MLRFDNVVLNEYYYYYYYFDVSTGCLHFEIDQEDTRRVSVVLEKKKKKKSFNYFLLTVPLKKK